MRKEKQKNTNSLTSAVKERTERREGKYNQKSHKKDKPNNTKRKRRYKR